MRRNPSPNLARDRMHPRRRGPLRMEPLELRLALSVDLAYVGILAGTLDDANGCDVVGPNSDRYRSSQAAAVDRDGNAYVLTTANQCNGTIDIDPGSDVEAVQFAHRAVMIAKVSHVGETVWTRSLDIPGGMGILLAVDDAGNVFLSGTFLGEADFDPGPGIVTKTADGWDGPPDQGELPGNLYLLKLSSDGAFEWVQNIEVHDIPLRIAVDANGNPALLVRMTSAADIDFDPSNEGQAIYSNEIGSVIVARYDGEDGSFVGGHEFFDVTESSGVHGSKLHFADDGSLFVALVWGNGQVDLDPGPGQRIANGMGHTVAALVKLDPSGDYAWSYEMHSQLPAPGQSTVIYGIDVSPTGEVYAVGQYSPGTDFDPGPGVLIPPIESGFVLRLSAQGSLDWLKTFNTLFRATSISLDAGDNLYFTGMDAMGSQIRVDCDPGPGVALATQEEFVASLTSGGDFRWAASLGNEGNYFPQLIGVAVTANGNVWVAGVVEGEIDLDPSEGEHPYSSESRDVFLVRLAQNLMPGDTNLDGQVDIIDLNNVRNNFGGRGLGDTDDDGVVGISDLNAVRNNFGAGGPSPALSRRTSGGVDVTSARNQANARESVVAIDAIDAWHDALFQSMESSRTSSLSTSSGIQARRLKAVDRWFARM